MRKEKLDMIIKGKAILFKTILFIYLIKGSEVTYMAEYSKGCTICLT